jgi:2-polyprenyl-3-methyl-5-hydroxy-6-metoxy-1,4-benzoquinol methylase
MPPEAGPTREEARRYYEEFSVAVGLRDWLAPNARHEQLKLLLADALDGLRGLKILDVGCGAGLMTDHLQRYGDAIGLDFSAAAIDLARKMAPGAKFVAGSLESLGREERFDLITLFDVLEHIPKRERPDFLGNISERLADEGTLFISTPFPEFTRHRRRLNDDTLQIIDEEVDLPEVLAEAADAGLQLLRFEAFDVFRGSPEYQAMVFTTTRHPGGPAVLRPRRLERRMRVVNGRAGRAARRVDRGLRLAAKGHLRGALWMLTGTARNARS